MTQVSKIPLRKEIQQRMFEVFLESIAMIHTRDQAERFLDDWISPTEKVMLAKRLSIALLLMKQYDQRSIAKLLHVGLETVSKVNKSYSNGKGGYSMVVKEFLRQEKSDAFWEKVDDVLAELLPPRHTDWSRWRKERWIEKMKSKKAY